MFKKLASCGLFIFLLSFVLTAQSYKIGSPLVRNFLREEYGAGPQNWAIDQDENGIMYFGNNDGLLEYDGTNWRLTPLPNKTIVRSINVNSETGRIYVGGQGTFGFFERNKTGQLKFTCLSDSIVKQEDKNFDDIWCIFTDNSDVIFTSYKMVARYREGQGVKVFMAGDKNLEYAFSIGRSLYAFRQEDGLVEIRDSTFKLVEDGEAFKNKGMNVKAILRFNETTRLIATEQKGLFTFDGQSPPKPWLSDMTSFFEDVIINTGAMLKGGKYAFATKLNGVIVIEKSTESEKSSGKLISQIDKDHGLPNDNVISIKQDKNGDLWLGLHNGIAKAMLSSPWNFIFIPPYTQIGAHGCALYKNKLYLVTPNGLFVKEFKDHEVLGQEFSLIKGSEGEAWNLSVVYGQLFLGHHNGAYCICDDGRLEQFDTNIGFWKFLEVPGHPELMVAGNYFGLVLFEKSAGSPCGWKFSRDFKFESSRIMEFDDEGTLWMTHVYKGIWKIKFSSDFSKMDTFHFGRTNFQEFGLPTINKINVFKIDGRIVFGTEKGIYDFASNRFSLNKQFESSFGDTTFVSFMTQDIEGNIWFWANGVPGKMNTNGKYKRENFPELNFLKGNFKSNFEFIQPLRDNNVIFGTADGFYKYGNNPSVPVVLPAEPITPKPGWLNALPWALTSVSTLLLVALLFIFTTKTRKVTPIDTVGSEPIDTSGTDPVVISGTVMPSIDETELPSGLTLLIEHGYEKRILEVCQQLKNTPVDISKLELDLNKFIKRIIPFEKQLSLYTENRAWIKKIKAIEKHNDTFWKVAVCLKNDMSEQEILKYLSIGSIKTVVDALFKHFHIKDMITLRKELKRQHDLTINDIKPANLAKCLDQIKFNLHLEPEKLLEVVTMFIEVNQRFDDHFQEYCKHKPWLSKLLSSYPNLSIEERMVCIGIRNDLSASEIGFLIYGRVEEGEKEKDKKKVEKFREDMWEIFQKDIAGNPAQRSTINEFIINYPDEVKAENS
ncbi:MAG: two-component regulator propeller domain-containing protein [Saprospiraceae bacterium]